MTQSLPEVPRLSHLKGQAKDLLQSLQERNPEALRRASAAVPRFVAPFSAMRPIKLADAQYVLALEYGFKSWTKLKQHVAVRDPEVLQEAFETVKDGWISVEDVPGDPAKLKRMLRQYPDLVNARIGPCGYTLLHFAAHRNFVEAANILIAAGANVHARAKGGATPLSVALTYPSPDIARLLDGFGRIPDNLRTAAGLGDLERMRHFFNVDGQLTADAGEGREEWALSYTLPARPLLHDPADILTEALVYAAQNGQIDAARILIENGAEVNRISFTGTALHGAALYNQRAAVDYLLSVGADLNIRDPAYDSNPAGWADYFGNRELASYLVNLGTDLRAEEVDHFAWTRADGVRSDEPAR